MLLKNCIENKKNTMKIIVLKYLCNGNSSFVWGLLFIFQVQVVGIDQAVPLLRRHVSSDPPFLLNANVSLGLFVLSQILVIASSLVLYLYGYGRFQAFLNQVSVIIIIISVTRVCVLQKI